MVEPLQVGKEFGKHKVLEKLGVGGMGIVYKVLDKDLDAIRALKVLNPFLAENQAFNRRFKEEAKNLAKLTHPNIVAVHTLDTSPDIGPYIVMEFVDGSTLKEAIEKSGRIPYDRATKIFKKVLRAVDYAHLQGIIHRDLKPSNIMLDKGGEVKITDFGLAKNLFDPNRTTTQGGAGTLYYMPPEQVEGMGEEDKRSDIYATGMTFYETLAGRTPFEKTETYSTIKRQILKNKGAFAPPTQFNAEIPKELAKIIMKSLDKDPKRRYQSAGEMVQALEAFEHGLKTPLQPPQPIRPDRLKTWIFAGAAVLLLALIIIRWNDIRALIWPSDSNSQNGTTAGSNIFSVAAGPVMLRAVPYGTIEVDGQPLATNAAQAVTWNATAAGKHTVRFYHPAHGEKQVQVQVGTSNAASRNLFCYFEAYYKITAATENGTSTQAAIIDNGALTGLNTPFLKYPLPPGVHRLTVNKPRHEVIPEEIVREVKTQVLAQPLKIEELRFQLKRQQ